MFNKLAIILMLAYPAVAHTALWLEQPLFVISYLVFIFSLFAMDKCINRHWYSGLALWILIAFVTYFIQQTYAQYLIYLPSIFILFSLFLLFSHSLQKGQTPLITHYAIILNNKQKLDEQHFSYTRSLTLVWAIFLLSMVIISITLAVFYSLASWSLFSNIISYVLITIFFVLEFFFRKRYFPNIPSLKGGFFKYIRTIIKIRPHHGQKRN